jgi:hypothetical protein
VTWSRADERGAAIQSHGRRRLTSHHYSGVIFAPRLMSTIRIHTVGCGIHLVEKKILPKLRFCSHLLVCCVRVGTRWALTGACDTQILRPLFSSGPNRDGILEKWLHHADTMRNKAYGASFSCRGRAELEEFRHAFRIQTGLFRGPDLSWVYYIYIF